MNEFMLSNTLTDLSQDQLLKFSIFTIYPNIFFSNIFCEAQSWLQFNYDILVVYNAVTITFVLLTESYTIINDTSEPFTLEQFYIHFSFEPSSTGIKKLVYNNTFLNISISPYHGY